MSDEIIYKPIGLIRTPFTNPKGIPIQSAFSEVKGTVILFSEYAKALEGLEGFSHIFLLYHFHRAKASRLIVKPFLADNEYGIFAVRAPNRPNPIGFSVVKLLSISSGSSNEEIFLSVSGVDMLDQTPLLDIKPYVPDFDCFTKAKTGWYSKRKNKSVLSDDRFSQL